MLGVCGDTANDHEMLSNVASGKYQLVFYMGSVIK